MRKPEEMIWQALTPEHTLSLPTLPNRSPFWLCQTSTSKVKILSLANLVPGDEIVTPGAIVQLVFSVRLAIEQDYSMTENSNTSVELPVNETNIEEDDVDILIDQRSSLNDGKLVPIPLAHAPYFPLVLPS